MSPFPPARVMVHYGSANRDERVFACPAAYDPRREGLGRHLAFGKGVHFCIGAPLARLELTIALPLLLERLRAFAWSRGRSPGSRSSSPGGSSASTSPGTSRGDLAAVGRRAASGSRTPDRSGPSATRSSRPVDSEAPGEARVVPPTVARLSPSHLSVRCRGPDVKTGLGRLPRSIRGATRHRSSARSGSRSSGLIARRHRPHQWSRPAAGARPGRARGRCLRRRSRPAPRRRYRLHVGCEHRTLGPRLTPWPTDQGDRGRMSEFAELIGKELGPTEWLEVDQERIDGFARRPTTRSGSTPTPCAQLRGRSDNHRARLPDAVAVRPSDDRGARAHRIPHGDQLRRQQGSLPAAVPSGSRVRARFTVQSVEEVAGGEQGVVLATVEREGGEKPVCVAELVVRMLR